MRVVADTWTKAQDDKLRTLWCDTKMSARLISEALGNTRSRNAVISRAHRLKLPERDPRGDRRAQRTHTVRHVRVGMVQKARKAARMNGGTHPMGYRWTGPREPVALPEDIPAPDCDPVSLLLRTNRQCSYIGGEPNGPDTLCCGAKVERRGLCRHHLDLCWYKPVKQRRTAVFGLIGLQAKARAA